MTFVDVSLRLLEGFGTTCLLFVVTLVAALPLGLIVAFGSMSRFKPLRYVVKAFVWIIRGTPLMLQVFVVFYIPSLVFNIPMNSRIMAVTITRVIFFFFFSAVSKASAKGNTKRAPYWA